VWEKAGTRMGLPESGADGRVQAERGRKRVRTHVHESMQRRGVSVGKVTKADT